MEPDFDFPEHRRPFVNPDCFLQITSDPILMLFHMYVPKT